MRVARCAIVEPAVDSKPLADKEKDNDKKKVSGRRRMLQAVAVVGGGAQWRVVRESESLRL